MTMRLFFSVFFAIAPALIQAQEVSPLRFAIVIPVDTDTGTKFETQLRGVVQGALARMSGRDPVVIEEPDSFTRFVVGGTFPEVPVRVYVGYATGLGVGMLDILAELPGSITQQIEQPDGTSITEIERRLIVIAESQGADHVWVLRRTGRTDGEIVTKFRPIAELLP